MALGFDCVHSIAGNYHYAFLDVADQISLLLSNDKICQRRDMDQQLHQLRASTAGQRAAVEVNQRHLIDKILARYSSEFTIYRELIQNANDAGARAVEICFSSGGTTGNAPVSVVPNTFQAVTIKNDGRPFMDEDWLRLRRIAEGNPVEEKIGFFGVGFYSVFSLADEPFIHSGDQCMVFEWVGDQLYTKHGPASEPSPWTSFYLKLRQPNEELPNIEDFSRFLGKSLLFTANLTSITVTSDDVRLINITKKLSTPQVLPIFGEASKQSLFGAASARQMLTLNAMETCSVQIDVWKLRSVKKSLVQTLFGLFATAAANSNTAKISTSEHETFNFFLRVFVGHVDVRLPVKIVSEMERTTKKAPPRRTRIQMIFSGHDELQASQSSSSSSPSSSSTSFAEFIPHLEQGRVYIGFETHQTTGIPMHIAAHFIPTVERENLDFVDRTLAVWNQELLSLCGVMARLVYEHDFQRLSRVLAVDEPSPSPLTLNQHQLDTARHLIRAFVIKPSTPIAVVSRLIQHMFHGSWKRPVAVLSSHGVLPADRVRLPNPAFGQFCKTVPVIPESLVADCQDLVATVREQQQQSSVLLPIQFDDVVGELSRRQLNADEFVAMLRWWLDHVRNAPRGSITEHDARRLMSVALVPPASDAQSPQPTVAVAPVPMSRIITFANIRVIPPHLPTPTDCLPVHISKMLTDQQLQALGLLELKLEQWCDFVITQHATRFGADREFTESVLEVVCRHFPRLSQSAKTIIISMLGAKKCVFAKVDGATEVVVKPGECYMKSVTLFDDLPKQDFHSRHLSDNTNFLKSLGIRSHVELQMVFDRLQDLKWDLHQLVKYLASVQEQFAEHEWARLRQTPIFTASGGGTNRFTASQLYPPTDEFINLGVPVLDWPKDAKWFSNNTQGRFMHSLGLRTSVPLVDLLSVAAGTDDTKRAAALAHFANHFSEYRSLYDPRTVNIPFLPADPPAPPGALYRPALVFAERQSSVLGFPVLRADLVPQAEIFGVRQNPPGDMLVDAVLASKPVDIEKACIVFAYLSKLVGDLTRAHLKQLNGSAFIPVAATGTDGTIKHVTPAQVYFKSQSSASYGQLFYYVDFGPEGNAFLRACGVKDEPTPAELAAQLIRAPNEFLNTGGIEQYMAVLRQLALHFEYLKRDSRLLQAMRSSQFLIAYSRRREKSGDDDTGTNSPLTYLLAKATDISLIDDTVMQQLFPSVLSAPMEALLEEFYESLGARWLSTDVQESLEPRGTVRRTRATEQLTELIRERAPLLVYDYGSGGGGGNGVRNKSADKALALLMRMKVVEAEAIESRKTFRRQTHTSLTTAYVDHRSAVLCVCPNFDFFDVAKSVGKFAFDGQKNFRLNDALLCATLLSTPLKSLEAKGFPVDRVVLKPPPPIVAPPQPPASQLVTPPEVTTAPSQQEELPENVSDRQVQPPAYPPRVPSVGSLRDSLLKPRWLNKMIGSGGDGGGPSGPSDKPLPTPITSTSSQQRAIPVDQLEEEQDARESRALLADVLQQSAKSSRATTQDVIAPPRILQHDSRSMQCGDLTSSQNLRIRGEVVFVPAGDVGARRSRITVQIDERLGEPFVETVLGLRETMKDGQYPVALRAFATLLSFLAVEVFEVNMEAVNIYYGLPAETDTIAFNRGRSLFFNYRHFISKHSHALLGLRQNAKATHEQLMSLNVSSQPVQMALIGADTCVYWFLVYAHELAHNFVAAHNAEHEYYMSSYADVYMMKLWRVMKAHGLQP